MANIHKNPLLFNYLTIFQQTLVRVKDSLTATNTIISTGKTKLLSDHGKIVKKKPYFLYWKTYFIFSGIGDDKHELGYGYLNVRKRDKRFFDELLESVTPLTDTTIVTDSTVIKFKDDLINIH